jgi:hypothetical protein
MERISLDKSQFLREKHAQLGQEAEARRRVVELSQELEVARASVLHEQGLCFVHDQNWE